MRAGSPCASLSEMVDEDGAEVPHDGETLGEITVRGNVVMKGYYNDPEATDAAIRNGWFHSGDAAVVHPDGFVARVKIKGKFNGEKEFHMASSTKREEHVVYVKQGFEEMACVKPLDLFQYDCAFGNELSQAVEMFHDHAQPAKEVASGLDA